MAARYTKGLQSDQGRVLSARLDTAAPYPATTAEIAARVFEGDRKQAKRWAHAMVTAGYLERPKTATYIRTGVNPA